MESLAHIIQKCPSTEGPRHARLDSVVRMLETVLTQMGYLAKREPQIPTVKGTRIPDLCAWNSERYIVCDVAVVSDYMDLDKVHQFKTNKYNITDIHRWMRQNNPRQDSGLRSHGGDCHCLHHQLEGCNLIGDVELVEKNRPSKTVFDVVFNKIRTLLETHRIWKIFRINAWRERRRRRPRRTFMGH